MKPLHSAAPFAVLVALNVLFRLPALINASGVHSDAAIVGLQAMAHAAGRGTACSPGGANYPGFVRRLDHRGFVRAGRTVAAEVDARAASGTVLLCRSRGASSRGA